MDVSLRAEFEVTEEIFSVVSELIPKSKVLCCLI